MPNAYEALYAWAHAAFGLEPFTNARFRAAFPSPAPAKVLSDLSRLGYFESPRRGVYRVVPPESRLRRLVEREASFLDLAPKAGLPYAYSRETAVGIWTDGAYWTGFTAGFRPVHLRVRRPDLAAWRRFFRERGARATVQGSRETLFGVVHVLHPVKRLRRASRGGVSVIPAADAYRYARGRPYLFDPVLPTLRRLAGRGG